MSLVFVGLGSNLGEGRENLQEAWCLIGAVPGVTSLSLSSPYRSSPVGVASDFWFTNAVGALDTTLFPSDFLRILLGIEASLGRDRSKGSDRTIDLDILYYDDLLFDSPELTIPHPEIARRLFVLFPLEEVAPDHVHPGNNMTSRAMCRHLLGSGQLSHGQSIEKTTWSA